MAYDEGPRALHRAVKAKPSLPAQPATEAAASREEYTDYGVNAPKDPAKDRLSTFSVDVDTASYAIARSYLKQRRLPPFASVRAEEFINYFDYDYASPAQKPFATHMALAPSPFEPGHHLFRVALQAKRQAPGKRKPAHLVYLVDTSGSMRSAKKMGLVKHALTLLTQRLGAHDSVALSTYAGSVRQVLAPTSGDQKRTILKAIDGLSAAGSTSMASGIGLAYKLAEKSFVNGHTNRVIVLSDGDANVGPNSHHDILKTIARYRHKGISLSTIGFGRGNYKDTMMEQLANKGDGNYAYIDTKSEARRVFVKQLDSMLEVAARDTKVQVEFDPAQVKSYRLIGYENRRIADHNFRNDKVDAGEVGLGHSVTAVYDVVLKANASRIAKVRIRYKKTAADKTASELSFKMARSDRFASFDQAPQSFRLASAVAAMAEILRRSPHAQNWSIEAALEAARGANRGKPAQRELVALLSKTRQLLARQSNRQPLVAR